MTTETPLYRAAGGGGRPRSPKRVRQYSSRCVHRGKAQGTGAVVWWRRPESIRDGGARSSFYVGFSAGLTGALLALGACAGPTETPANPYRIEPIVYEYFSQRENTVQSPAEHIAAGQAHWNEIDYSLFLRITVQGPKGSYEPGRSVRVVAAKGDERVFDGTLPIGVLSASTGQYTIPFLVHGPLCETVFITASVEGQKPRISASRQIEFHCGE